MARPPFVPLPNQCSPTTEERTASAPYNFIPLPDQVVTAVDQAECLPDHNTYITGDPEHPAYSGYFEVTLTTQTPLYVRTGLSKANFLLQEDPGQARLPYAERVRNTPDFFHHGDPNRPVIPWSSLRGMLRSMLEIAGYGKVERVTDQQQFFRALVHPALRQAYAAHFIAITQVPHGGGQVNRYESLVRGGFMRKRGSQWIIEECELGRISRRQIVAALNLNVSLNPEQVLYTLPINPMSTPRWSVKDQAGQGIKLQNREIFVEIAAPADHFKVANPRHDDMYLRYRAVTAAHATDPHNGMARGATLVLTGNVPHKSLEFVLLNGPVLNTIPVPPDLVDRFLDDDQLTRWQEEAFKADSPVQGWRPRNGGLRAGEPVFFLADPVTNELRFFGRAQMFRLPYRYSPLDLTPEALRRPEDIDFAEALFGYVRTSGSANQGTKERSYAGRVQVTDAELLPNQPQPIFEEPFTPRILASPKPTSFQHYLVQEQEGDTTLAHYDQHPPKTVIRGHKRYWLQGDRTVEEHLKQTADPPAKSTQHTRMRPVRAGRAFRFSVRFANLSAAELGALCWILHPRGPGDATYCHSLGMGKSLGMGEVTLDAVLFLIDRRQRYRRLFAAVPAADEPVGAWETGVLQPAGELLSDPATLARYTAAFEQHMLRALGLAGQTSNLYDVRRIALLLRMISCQGIEPHLGGARRHNVRTMNVDEFRSRPVLPDPEAVSGVPLSEPCLAPVDLAVAATQAVEQAVAAANGARGSAEKAAQAARGATTVTTASAAKEVQRATDLETEAGRLAREAAGVAAEVAQRAQEARNLHDALASMEELLRQIKTLASRAELCAMEALEARNMALHIAEGEKEGEERKRLEEKIRTLPEDKIKTELLGHMRDWTNLKDDAGRHGIATAILQRIDTCEPEQQTWIEKTLKNQKLWKQLRDYWQHHGGDQRLIT